MPPIVGFASDVAGAVVGAGCPRGRLRRRGHEGGDRSCPLQGLFEDRLLDCHWREERCPYYNEVMYLPGR